jgi:large subunit ribosomal protein L10
MPTADKAATVAEIKEKLTASSAVILTDYRGLTVKEMQSLRTSVRKAGGDVKVYKNTLTVLAVRELAMPQMDDLLQGPTLFTFAAGDPVSTAKALMDFAKDHQQLEVKGGFIESQVVGADSVKALASLPSREQLLAKLLGTMNNPMSQFVRVLNGPAAAFARALNAIAQQKQAA